MSKPKIILLSILLLPLVIIIVTVSFSPRKPKQGIVEPPPQKITQPKPTTFLQGKLQIESRLKKDNFQVPDKLPIYEFISPKVTYQSSLETARKLGFSSDPFILTDASQGTVYLWSEDSKYLKIVPSQNIIDYKNSIISINKTILPNDELLIEAAKKFLQDSQLIDTNKIKLYKIQFFDSGVEDFFTLKDRADADLASVLFQESIDKYPIINPSPDVGTINVKVNTEEKIVAVYLHQLKNVKRGTEYPLKSFEEFEISLAKATIHSLDNGNIDLLRIKQEDTEKVYIDNLSIAYLTEFSSSQEILQPIFLLSGSAKLRDGRLVSALLYLPAISERFFR